MPEAAGPFAESRLSRIGSKPAAPSCWSILGVLLLASSCMVVSELVALAVALAVVALADLAARVAFAAAVAAIATLAALTSYCNLARPWHKTQLKARCYSRATTSPKKVAATLLLLP